MKSVEKWTRPQRAAQAWSLLTDWAGTNRRTLTYTQLDTLMNRNNPTSLGPILLYIKVFCDAKGLPPLTSIVVSKTTGIPSNNMGDESQSKVFDFNWGRIGVPTPEELDATFRQH